MNVLRDKKICSTCHETKFLYSYYKSSRSSDGFRGVCKVCVNNNIVTPRKKPYLENGIGYIPCHRRNKNEVFWALVDEIDYDKVKNITWSIHTNGYIYGAVKLIIRKRFLV